MTDLVADKVFISYSWSTPEHEQWVINLAKQLELNKVPVVFDKWDVQDGQNLNQFMQRAVNDPTIQKVIVICDEIYTKKANGFEGGVGTETVIISQQVYENSQQTKFIPIVTEKNSDGKPFIPTYFSGAKYIDMSSDQSYIEGYEKLLRNLFNKPEYERPEGTKVIPSFLLSDNSELLLLSQHALAVFINHMEKRPDKATIHFIDFTEEFLKDYISFAISTPKREEIAEKTSEALHSMLALKNIYIQFIISYVRLAENLESQRIAGIFEQMYSKIKTRPAAEGSTVFYDSQFDHMKFFLNEIVISTGAVLLKYEEYQTFKEVFTHEYILKDIHERESKGTIGYLQQYPSYLEQVQPRKLGQAELISYSGFLLKERSQAQVSFEELKQAELMIRFIDYAWNKESIYYWRILTSPYINGRSDIMRKLISKTYFEKIKDIFNVTNSQEFKVLLSSFIQHLRQNPSYKVSISLKHAVLTAEEIEY